MQRGASGPSPSFRIAPAHGPRAGCEEHEASRRWLQDTQQKHSQPQCVVTHHAPSRQAAGALTARFADGGLCQRPRYLGPKATRGARAPARSTDNVGQCRLVSNHAATRHKEDRDFIRRSFGRHPSHSHGDRVRASGVNHAPMRARCPAPRPLPAAGRGVYRLVPRAASHHPWLLEITPRMPPVQRISPRPPCSPTAWQGWRMRSPVAANG